MARPELENLHKPGEVFIAHFKRAAASTRGLPNGFSIDTIAHCALARYRQGAEYLPEVNSFIDAVVASMR